MKSGEPGETWVGICEEKYFVSFLSLFSFGEGVDGLLTFICIYARRAYGICS